MRTLGIKHTFSLMSKYWWSTLPWTTIISQRFSFGHEKKHASIFLIIWQCCEHVLERFGWSSTLMKLALTKPVLNKHGWMTETKTSWIVWRIKTGEEQQLRKRLKMNWHFVRPGGKVLKTYLCTGALRFTSRWKDNIYKLTSVVGTHLRQMYKILVLLLT